MRSRTLVRCASLLASLVLVASFALPCLCAPASAESRGHCGESQDGPRILERGCCCESAHPGASEGSARFLPTPAPNAVAPVSVGVLPASFSPTLSAPEALVARARPSRPVGLVLRI